MYKLCERCRFNVPAKQSCCQVCGSQDFVTMQAQERKSLVSAEQIESCRAGLEGAKSAAKSAMSGFLSGFMKEVGELSGKVQRATDSMRKLVFEAGDEQDRVLSFHRNIGGGRSVDFAPVIVGRREEAPAVKREEMPRPTLVESAPAPVREPLTLVARSVAAEPTRAELLSDDAVFAPKFDIVELKTSQAKLLAALAASCNAPDPSESANVESLRQQINDMTGWFQNFGKDGLLVKKAGSFEALAADDEDQESAEEPNEASTESQQAA
jgi:hypothetical protein